MSVNQDWATKLGLNWPFGPVSLDRTGAKGHLVRTKLASKYGPNWPGGPVHQDQTDPKGQ